MKPSLLKTCSEVYNRINAMPENKDFTFRSLIDEYDLDNEDAVLFMYKIMEAFQGSLATQKKQFIAGQKFIDMPITKVEGPPPKFSILEKLTQN